MLLTFMCKTQSCNQEVISLAQHKDWKQGETTSMSLSHLLNTPRNPSKCYPLTC